MRTEDIDIGMDLEVLHWGERPEHWASNGEMDYLCGQIVRVLELRDDKFFYFRDEDGEEYEWVLAASDVEPYMFLEASNPNRVFFRFKGQRSLKLKLAQLRKKDNTLSEIKPYSPRR